MRCSRSPRKRKPSDAGRKGAAASFDTKAESGAQAACPQKTANPVHRDSYIRPAGELVNPASTAPAKKE